MTNNNRNICHTKQYKNKRYDMKYQIKIKDSTGAVCLGEFCESSTSLPMRSVTCIKLKISKYHLVDIQKTEYVMVLTYSLHSNIISVPLMWYIFSVTIKYIEENALFPFPLDVLKPSKTGFK